LNIRLQYDSELKTLLEDEIHIELQNDGDETRTQLKANIAKIQEENRHTYNKSRKQKNEYNVDDLEAIKRKQFGPGLKLKNNFLGPYNITRKLRHGRYVVEKVGEDEKPNKKKCSKLQRSKLDSRRPSTF